jgi:hypothetical protein
VRNFDRGRQTLEREHLLRLVQRRASTA